MMIHLDLDSFFISAERIIKPTLRGIPAAVGGRGDPFIFDPKGQSKIDSVTKNQGAFVPSIFYDAKSDFESYFLEGSRIRGIIITASYEARALGIKTGMTIREALNIYPDLIVVPPNHLYYHELSHQLFTFLQHHIPKVEQFSIDEFFADLHGWVSKEELLPFLQDLQAKIDKEFSLPISIGAARSKWTAKLATSFAKPHGIKIVEDVESFIKDIPIEEFPGIGRGYLRRLSNYGIKKLGEIKPLKNLFYSWKKPGIQLYKRILGIDNEPIQSASPKKSLGISRTIDPIKDRGEIKRRLIVMSRYLATTLASYNLQPFCYGLSLRYDFGGKTKAHLCSNKLFNEKLFIEIVLKLLQRCDLYTSSPIVRLGIRVWDFYKPKIYDLTTFKEDRKFASLSDSLTTIRSKYGINQLKWAVELE